MKKPSELRKLTVDELKQEYGDPPPAPVVSGLDPSSGPAAGGTSVTIGTPYTLTCDSNSQNCLSAVLWILQNLTELKN